MRTVTLIASALMLLAGCGEKAFPTEKEKLAKKYNTTEEEIAALMAEDEKKPIMQIARDRDMYFTIVRDRETGCEYISAMGGGVTPRNGRYINGVQEQMGCTIETHDPAPQ